MTKFNVGDEVTLTTRPGMRATVEYGPFDRSRTFEDIYVVKLVDEPTDPDEVRTFTALASVMKLAPKFTIGDKVTTSLCGPGEVVAGPFKGRGTYTRWAVKLSDDAHVFPASEALTKVVEPEPIKIGDTVRVVKDSDGYRSGHYVGQVGVVASILPGNELPYKIRFGDGTGSHGDSNGHWYCAEVERVADENTYTHAGVTYDLSSEYTDRDGDEWRLARVSGVVRARMASDREAPTAESFTLERIVERWGPLTRVTD